MRPIFIDGQNVGVQHANEMKIPKNDKGQNVISSHGIRNCVQFFKNRGHEVVVVLPKCLYHPNRCTDFIILKKLEKDGILKLTPSISYDDRYITKNAKIR